jgi:GT2 family glycosyltransferase
LGSNTKSGASAGQPIPPGPISVVIVNYNGAAHLEHSLDAVFAQSVKADEVLLVDNASTDGSELEACERHPSVRLIRLEKNDGPCPARNAGLAAARNAWVLLLDNDAVLLPDTLAQLANAAAVEPSAALLQPRSVFASEPTRVHYDGGSLHYAGVFSLRNFYAPLAEAEGEGAVAVDGAVSVALLVRRELVLELGGFDPAYFILFEDLDLSLRLGIAGYTILSVEHALVHHRGGTPGISFRSGPDYPHSRTFFHARNRGFVLLKNYSWSTLFVSLPGLALYEFVWFCFALVNGGLFAHLHGKLAFFFAIPRTLRLRRAVQRTRVERDSDLLVGGPLTITPGLKSSKLRIRVLSTLDRFLAWWWRVVRPLIG